MKYRRDDSAIPRVAWLVGSLEVLAPADWSEAEVRAGLRGILARSPLPVSAVPIAPGSMKYALKPFFDGGEEIDGHRWVATAWAAWRDDAPPPCFDPDRVRGVFARDEYVAMKPDDDSEQESYTRKERLRVTRQSLEQFVGGRSMRRRAFPWALSRVPDEALRGGGAMFVRADAQPVWLSIDYAPWWRLTLEQAEDPLSMIRVSVDGEPVAYVMPMRAPVERVRRARRGTR